MNLISWDGNEWSWVFGSPHDWPERAGSVRTSGAWVRSVSAQVVTVNTIDTVDARTIGAGDDNWTLLDLIRTIPQVLVHRTTFTKFRFQNIARTTVQLSYPAPIVRTSTVSIVSITTTCAPTDLTRAPDFLTEPARSGQSWGKPNTQDHSFWFPQN